MYSGIARRVWLTAGFVVIALLAAYIAICSYMALTITRPSRLPFRVAPEAYALRYEAVTFPSRVDAVALDGWLFEPAEAPARRPRRPIVVVHGRGADRTREANGRMLEITAELVRHGHPVLLFDLRGSGRSGGERFTLGVYEVRDVGGAIDFLAGRGLASDGVNLLGYSMGGATSLLFAPDEPLVRAIVEDSAYAQLNDLLDTQVPKASGLPGFFTPGMVFMARPLLGMDLHAVRPVEALPRMAARGVPLLVIHGEADSTVPVRHGHMLAAAYGSAVETMFVPGAEHVRSYERQPSIYITRVVELFARGEG